MPLTQACCSDSVAEELTPEFRTLLPVGNLSASEAREFCRVNVPLEFPLVPQLDDASWARVHKVRL